MGRRDEVRPCEVISAIERQRIDPVLAHLLVLSPGVDGADVRDYARTIMKELGSRRGLDLDWYAVKHANTANSHAHVVVLRKDKSGHHRVSLSLVDYDLMREVGDRYLWRQRLLTREPLREQYRAPKERDDFTRRLEEKGRTCTSAKMDQFIRHATKCTESREPETGAFAEPGRVLTMPGSSHFESTVTDIPASDFAAVAVSALRKLGCADPFLNEGIRWCTARFRQQEIVSNTIWDYEFVIDLNWEAIDKGCAVKISIVENKQPSSLEKCKKKAAEITEEIARISETIKQSPPPVAPEGAQWEPTEQLAAVGYVGSVEDSRCLVIAKTEEGFVRLPPEDSVRGALVAGSTGLGKSSRIFIPNLDERLFTSAIVTEATMGSGKADLYMKTAGYRAGAGNHIYYFNPEDLSSHRINPLDQVHDVAGARRVAEILMQSTNLGTHKGDQTWEMAERLLLRALILYAVGERKNGNGNLGFVLDLLSQGAEALSIVFENSHFEEAQQVYDGFFKNSTEAFRNSVAAGLITRLSLWQDPKIRALTEATDIDFAKLPQELFTIYLSTPAHKPELKPLAALMFNLFLDFACSEHELSYPLALFLDEFCNFGYVQGMPQKLSIIRHAGIGVVIGIQDYVQLELLYGQEASLFLSQPGTKIFFRPNDFQTAENISRGLGIAKENQVKVTSSGQLHENIDKKPLLSPDQLMAMEKASIIVFTPRTRPIRLTAISWQDYEAQGEFRPPARRVLEVNAKLTARKVVKKPSHPDDWPSTSPSLASQSLVNEALSLSKGERYLKGAWG